MKEGSLFTTTSPTLVITCLVDNSHFNMCEVVSHCSFDLHFAKTSEVEHIQISVGHLYIFLGEVSVYVLCSIIF